MADPLVAAVAAAQEEHSLLQLPAAGSLPLVVGVSGGVDSVCLLHALRTLADAWRLALHVAHVDHGLRPASGRDRAFVQELAARCQLPFHAAALDAEQLRAHPSGLEAAARAARYAFLAQVARLVSGAHPPCAAVAHHANDQAETLLLRLVSGSGLRGLGGLRPAATAPVADDGPPVRLVRPLLAVQRADILAYAARHSLAYVEDETNADTQLARSYLRHVVLPPLARLNPNLVATLARSAELLAAEAERTEAEDAAALARLLVEPFDGERIVLDLLRWQSLPLAARRGVLRQALAQLAQGRCTPGREIGFEHVEDMMRSAAGGRSSGPHPLPQGLAWSVIGAAPPLGARLSLHAAAAAPLAVSHPFLAGAWQRGQAALPLPIPGEVQAGAWRLVAQRLPAAALPDDWREQADPWRLYADASRLGEPCLGTPAPGMRIAPLGMGGAHRLVADVLGGHKIPRAIRQGWPLLLDRRSGQVLWVCGLRMAETLRITAQTQDVVCLAWQCLPGTTAPPGRQAGPVSETG